MGQVFIIAKSPNFDTNLKLDYSKFFSVKGTTISYIASIILFFLPESFDFEYYYESLKGNKLNSSFKNELDNFAIATPGYDALGLESISSNQFQQVYQALLNGYIYLKSLNIHKRHEWISKNTIYGHVENLWDTTTWAGKYKNHKGEERDNNMKNVLEDILDMMKLDERFDPSLVEEKSIDEIKKILEENENSQHLETLKRKSDKTKTFFQKLFGK